MAIAPQTKPMAFLSDIHGNLPALDAVLANLELRGVKDIFVAGDMLLGGEQPLEVWRRLVRCEARCIRGTSDTALCNVNPDQLAAIDEVQQKRLDAFRKTRRVLGELVIAQLRRLPDQLRIPMIDGREIAMVHGSPLDVTTETHHAMDDDELNALIDGDPADVIVCGASHVAFQRQVGEVHIVNVGSIGEAPEGRNAHFTVITPAMDGPMIDPTWVEY